MWFVDCACMSWQVNHTGQSPHPGGSFVSASLLQRILAQYMQFYLAILCVEVLNCTSISQGMCCLVPHRGKLSREKTFGTLAVLWLFAKASNP